MKYAVIFLSYIIVQATLFRVQAQDPIMVNFTMEDGLPSNQIHDLCIGPYGRLFIATDNGLSVYDGNKFENLSQENGLDDVAIIKLFKDANERIWFVSLSGQVYYFENGKVKIYKYNQEILNFKMANPYPIIDFNVDSANKVSIAFNLSGILKIDSAGKTINICKKSTSSEYKTQFIEESEIGNILFYTEYNNNYVPFRDSTLTYFNVRGNSIEILQNREKMPYDFFNHIIFDNKLYLSLGSYYYELDDFEILNIKKFEKPIVDFLIDSIHNLFGFHGGGLLIIPKVESKINGPHFILNGLTISSIIKDNRNGIWIATVQSGLFYIPDIENHMLNDASDTITDIITAIASNSNSLYFGDAEGSLFELTEENIIKKVVSNITINKSPILKIIIDQDRLLFNSLNEIKLIDSNGVNGIEIHDRASKTIKDIYKSPNGDILLTGQNIWKLKNNYKIESLIKKETNLFYFNAIYYAGYDDFWLGTDHGLYYYSNDEIIFLGKDIPSLAIGISSLSVVNGHLIIGTKGKGLLIYEPQSNRVSKIIIENRKLQIHVKNILLDRSSSCWISSHSGLFRIRFGLNKTIVDYFNENQGVISRNINDLTFLNSSLYLATDKGVICIDTSVLLKYKIAPELIISKIKINNENAVLKEHYNLPYNKNNIEISFNGVDLREGKNLIYLYKIDSNEYNITSNNVLKFLELDPGEYSLIIKTKNLKNNFESVPKNISFTISPPFWKTWWFMSIEACFAISTVSFIFIKRANMLDSKSEREVEINRKIANLEMKALRTQMNPHFLFNSLNSIYSMINAGKNDVASQFLLRFSKLLRIVIEQSPIAKISLAEELKLLSIYVDLEKTRFNNKFDFELIIEDGVDPDMLLIPSFILQPFAENAIIHGLMNKREDDRKLEIIIKLHEGELHCIIRDNGVGRNSAQLEKEKRGNANKSVAISNTKQRLEIVNIDIKNPIVSVEVKDLKDHNFKAVGTEVYLRIKKELVDLDKLKEGKNS